MNHLYHTPEGAAWFNDPKPRKWPFLAKEAKEANKDTQIDQATDRARTNYNKAYIKWQSESLTGYIVEPEFKVYVASSWRNDFQPMIVEHLRNLGHQVYDFRNSKEGDHGFHWSEIDPNWRDWNTDEYNKGLTHELAEEGFKQDFDNMAWANVCVLLLPCGRSAHSEAGFMKGEGKKVYVLCPEKIEPELMYKMYDGVYQTIESLSKDLSHYPEGMTLSDQEFKDKWGWVKRILVEETATYHHEQWQPVEEPQFIDKDKPFASTERGKYLLEDYTQFRKSVLNKETMLKEI